MKPASGLRAWAVYGLLLTLAAGAALIAGNAGRAQSRVPSIDNPGPLGARALRVYLEETGRDVLALREPLTSIPAQARVLVLASPTARAVTPEERNSLEAFVQSGGTLVYLAPRSAAPIQHQLEDWLGISSGPRAAGGAWSPDGLDDLGGASVPVTVPLGAARGLKRLRVSADGTVRVEGASAVPVAQGALWWKRLGEGQLWISSGADLIENRRLELEDNLGFWENLAGQGPIAFDEHHHHSGAPLPLSRAFAVFALQLLACTALFALARGTRLGPARPLLRQRQRSSLEYLHSLSHLTRRAGVERELIAELAERLRRLLQERLGIGLDLSDEEAARQLERQGGPPFHQTQGLLSQARSALLERASPREYARLSREFARIERAVLGQE